MRVETKLCATLDLSSLEGQAGNCAHKRSQIIIQSDAKHEYRYYYHDINGTTND